MRSIVFALASLLVVSASPVFAQDKLNPGDNMPGMKTEMKNVTGASTTLEKASGQNGLLVMFSCNTCPFVVKNQPITNKTIAYAKEHNIGVVVINSNEGQRDNQDSYDAMIKYAKEQGYQVPYLVDEKSALADMFGASHTPEIFLFNKQHKLVYKGAMNDNPGSPESYKKMYINDAIDAVVAGKEPNPKTTKSIGCSIKRKA